MADRLRSIGSVLRWPLCIAMATLIGLVGALVGGLPWQWGSWLALTIPILTVAGCLVRVHKKGA